MVTGTLVDATEDTNLSAASHLYTLMMLMAPRETMMSEDLLDDSHVTIDHDGTTVENCHGLGLRDTAAVRTEGLMMIPAMT